VPNSMYNSKQSTFASFKQQNISKMKYSTIIAFFGLAATGYSAKLMLSSEEGVKVSEIHMRLF